MFGSFVLAVSSIAATLLPFPGVSTHARGGANAYPLRMDRLSITKRIIEAHLHLKPAKIKLSVIPQALHYRSIRAVNCGDCYASDINSLGQISVFTDDPMVAPGVVDANNHIQALSPLLSNDRPYLRADATALNDVGGVAGTYDGNNISGDLVWQLQNGVYKGLYFDGRENYAEALAINDYDITVGDNNEYPVASIEQPEIYSQFIPRHVLLGLNEPQCNSNTLGSADGINDANTIVGYEYTCEGQQAVRFTPYGYAKTFLPRDLSEGGSSASAVNQSDDITGTCESGPFLFQAASNHTALLSPRPEWDPDGYFYALGLNSSDQVIGDYEEAQVPNYETGWLNTGGKTYDLNALLPKNSGWIVFTANAINNAGQIIGQGQYLNPTTGGYISAAYVMTP